MRGRQVFFETLINHGVDRIFGNPGTTESPLLDALLDYPQMKYIVHLHEGVATGAANFYAQASGKTAFVNLHVAPGLGNAIGMIYGALKNNSPMVVTAGQQDTRMRLRDPVLGGDLVAIAAPVTKWSVQVQTADELGPILQRAFKIANEAPAGPVFVALPINVMEQETSIPAGKPGHSFTTTRPDPAGIAVMARLLLAARSPAIVAGDDIARAGADKTLVKLVEKLGASVWFEGLRGQNSFPTDHPAARGTLAFDAPGVAKQFADNDLVLMVGGPFFEEVWYAPGSPFPAGCKVLQIEAAPSRLAYNFALDAGVVADVGAGLAALDMALATVADEDFTEAAGKRNATLQALKESEAAAHHDLAIVFVILANREYRVLKHNIDAYRARFDVKSNKPYMHMDLGSPTMGFVDMAKGMGVAGTYVSKADDIKAAVAAAFKIGKPHLIEIEIEGKR